MFGGADARPNKGGRPKGSPNKRSLEVAAQLASLGCDPIKGMARIAMDDVPCRACDAKGKLVSGEPCGVCFGRGKEPVPTDLRAKMYAELAQYVAPKRKAIEASGPGGGPIQAAFTIDLSE